MANKTKTCPRCKGAGFVSAPVVHLGMPGGCYQCDLTGTVQWASREDLNRRVEGGVARYLEEIEGRAAEQKARFEALSDKRKAKYAKTLETSLADLRTLWLEVKQGNHPMFKLHKKGKWVAAK